MQLEQSAGDMNCKFNWSEHAKAHNNFLSQDKFLSSNFLFSLSTQKPQVDAAMDVRYIIHSVVFLLKVGTIFRIWSSIFQFPHFVPLSSFMI